MSLSAFSDFCLSPVALAGKQMNPALHPSKLSLPISSRACSSVCRFIEKHCAEISLQALRTCPWPQHWSSEIPPRGCLRGRCQYCLTAPVLRQFLRAGPLPFADPLLQAKALTGLREECQDSLGSTHLSGLLGPGWKMT